MRKIKPDICSQQGLPSPIPVAFPSCHMDAVAKLHGNWEVSPGIKVDRWAAAGLRRQGNHMHVFMVRETQDYTDLDSRGDSRNCG